MNLVLVFALAGLMQAIRSFQAPHLGEGFGTTLAFGYLLLTAYFAGTLFKAARLPKLTGYIAAGIVAGPAVLGFLTESMVQSLKIVNGVAIALIAMTAGLELEFREMRPFMRTILWITGVAVTGTTLLLATAVFFARPLLPFMAGLGSLEAMMIALVLGVVMVAQSPAVVIALRDETQAEGPVSRTVLGVVVIADLAVILLFAITSSVAKAFLGQGANVGATVRSVAWELFGSMGVGVLIGLLLAVYTRKVKGGAGLFLLAVSFIVAEVGQRLHLDPLLVALAAGILIRNATQAAPEIHHQIEAFSLPIYVLFFAVAGANLHLSVLATVGIPAVLFVVVRGIGLYYGTRVATALARAPRDVQRFAGFGLLPQAGLALALSMLFAKTFPEFGDAGALTLGVVALNELIAPVIFRAALVRSGEAGKLAPSSQPELVGGDESGLVDLGPEKA
ncbi:MAG: cation:proton antiporter [Deltaproteobacteria bacterium]|nr:cation:proton antiporter [Deltaproteobacteria bacterium]